VEKTVGARMLAFSAGAKTKVAVVAAGGIMVPIAVPDDSLAGAPASTP